MNQPFLPPEGLTFYSAAELPIAAAAAALQHVASFLQRLHPSDTPLSLHHDWLQHDGLHFPHGSIRFHELFQCFASSRALLAASHDDASVFIGVSAASHDWYLRFRAEWCAADTHLVASFSVTLSPELSERFQAEVVSSSSVSFSREPSTAYFQRITQ